LVPAWERMPDDVMKEAWGYIGKENEGTKGKRIFT
jgi:hypothetical protein